MQGRQRDAEYGIRSKPRLVFRAIKVDQRLIQTSLIAGIKTDDGLGDLAVHTVNDALHTFATVKPLISIPFLIGFVLTGRSA